MFCLPYVIITVARNSNKLAFCEYGTAHSINYLTDYTIYNVFGCMKIGRYRSLVARVDPVMIIQSLAKNLLPKFHF